MNTVVNLKRLDTCGIDFRSYAEPHISTENEATRIVTIAHLSCKSGDREDQLAHEKARLARMKAVRKRLGRPSVADRDRNRMLAALKAGTSFRANSRNTAVRCGSVCRIFSN